MSGTKLTHAGGIKVGSYILIDGVACKAIDVSRSKPGKHGAAKARIIAVGVLDGKKRDVVLPASDSVEVPIIQKKTANVLFISGDMANVMDSETYETFDLKIPKEFKDQIKEGVDVLYWTILDDKVIKQVKGK